MLASFLIYNEETEPKNSDNLPKVIQLICGRNRIQMLVILPRAWA